MSPQEEIADIKRRIDEMERAVRYYPPLYPPGYTPPPTAPYPHSPWPPMYPPYSPWPGNLPTVIYCAVAH